MISLGSCINRNWNYNQIQLNMQIVMCIHKCKKQSLISTVMNILYYMFNMNKKQNQNIESVSSVEYQVESVQLFHSFNLLYYIDKHKLLGFNFNQPSILWQGRVISNKSKLSSPNTLKLYHNSMFVMKLSICKCTLISRLQLSQCM